MANAELKGVNVGNTPYDFKDDRGRTAAYNCLKDTVGWTGKNLIPFPYYEMSHTEDDVDWRVFNDGSVTASGTATADSQLIIDDDSTTISIPLIPNKEYILSGCPSGGSTATFFTWIRIHHGDGTNTLYYDTGSGVPFSILSTDTGIRYGIGIKKNVSAPDATFYPMIREAGSDAEYEPPHKSVDHIIGNLSTHVGNMCGKNLIPYPYYQTTKTNYGVNFTDNGDGSITVDTGTSTNEAGSRIWLSSSYTTSNKNDIILEPNTTYTFSLLPFDTTGNLTCYINIYKLDKSENKWCAHEADFISNNGVITFTTDDTYLLFNPVIKVAYGKHLPSEMTVYPMLRLASDPDDTWEPYTPKPTQRLSHYDNGILGAKNLIPYPFPLNLSVVTKTVNNVAFTDNGDGTVTIVTDSTGATANTAVDLTATVLFHLEPNRAYIISGCTDGNYGTEDGGTSTYYLRMYGKDTDLSTVQSIYQSKSEKIFIPNSNVYGFNLQIFVLSGTKNLNVTIKPMIRLASDSDPTFRPHAKTNKELTDLITSPGWIDVSDTVTDSNSSYVTSARSVKYMEIGRFVFLRARIKFSRITDLPFDENGFRIDIVNCPNLPDIMRDTGDIPLSVLRAGTTHLYAANGAISTSKKLWLKGVWGFPDIDGVSRPAIPANEEIEITYTGMYPKA